MNTTTLFLTTIALLLALPSSHAGGDLGRVDVYDDGAWTGANYTAPPASCVFDDMGLCRVVVTVRVPVSGTIVSCAEGAWLPHGAPGRVNTCVHELP